MATMTATAPIILDLMIRRIMKPVTTAPTMELASILLITMTEASIQVDTVMDRILPITMASGKTQPAITEPETTPPDIT